MRFAEKDGVRTLPTPTEENAVCPLCKSKVIAKCGKIKIWHWAHISNKDCDNWSEGETAWHLNWKKEFPEDCQEVAVGKHRADVKIKGVVIEFQNSSISSEDILEREHFYEKMKWVLNGETFAKNLTLMDKKGYQSFTWKWMPKSWLTSNKEIYIDLDFLYKKYYKKFLEIADKNDDDTFSVGTDYTYWEEYADGVEYPKKGYTSYDKTYGEEKNELRCLFKKYHNKLFLIKKIYNKNNCPGWGKLISKEDFIMGVKDGYYRN